MIDCFDSEVAAMKATATRLVDRVRNAEDELDLSVLKTRSLDVDGYQIQVYYGIDKRPYFDLHSVRITPKDVPFLPFRLHCRRVAAAFLGLEHLALSEFQFLGGKMYVWSVGRSKADGNPVRVPLHPNAVDELTEGVAYQKAPVTKFPVPIPG